MTSEHISMLNGAINSHSTFLVSDDVGAHFYAEWCHQFSLYISGFRWRRSTFLCWMVPSILTLHFWFQMTSEHISMLNGDINSHSTFLVSDDVGAHFYAEWCHQFSLYISEEVFGNQYEESDTKMMCNSHFCWLLCSVTNSWLKCTKWIHFSCLTFWHQTFAKSIRQSIGGLCQIGHSFLKFLLNYTTQRERVSTKLCSFTIRNYIQLSLLIRSLVLSLHT